MQEKPKISIALDLDIYEWLQENIRNRSAFIRDLISNYRSQSSSDPKHASVATTLDDLKGLGLILAPGRIYRTLLELGLKHDPDIITQEVRESGRLLGVYFTSQLRDDDWLRILNKIIQDLFLDVNQISVTTEDEEKTLLLRVVSDKHSEGTLFLLGQFIEETLNQLGYMVTGQSMIFEQSIGILNASYARGL